MCTSAPCCILRTEYNIEWSCALGGYMRHHPICLTVAFLKMRRSLEEANQRNMQLEAALAKAASAHGAAKWLRMQQQQQQQQRQLRSVSLILLKFGSILRQQQEQVLRTASIAFSNTQANHTQRKHGKEATSSCERNSQRRQTGTKAPNGSDKHVVSPRQAEFPLPLRSIRPDINQDDPPAPLVPGTCGVRGHGQLLTTRSQTNAVSSAVPLPGGRGEGVGRNLRDRSSYYGCRMRSRERVHSSLACDTSCRRPCCAFPGQRCVHLHGRWCHGQQSHMSTLIEWVRRKPETVHAILAHAELPDRIQRLAMCRNVLMGEARSTFRPKVSSLRLISTAG